MKLPVFIKKSPFFLALAFCCLAQATAMAKAKAKNSDTLTDPSEMPPQEPPYTKAPNTWEDVPYSEPAVYDPLQDPVVEVSPSEEASQPEEIPVRKVENVVVRDLVEKKSDGTYFYKFEQRATDRKTGHFKAGLMSPPALSALIGGGYKLTFQEMYSSSPIPMFTYEREWALLDSWGGLRFQTGFGAFFTQGRGRFVRDVQDYEGQPTNIAKEKYSFFGFPLSAGLILRMQIQDSWFVPFANGGLNFTGLFEERDDAAKRTLLGSPSVYAGGGAMLNLTSLDRDASFVFDRDYSIRHLWLTAEARLIRSFSKDLDTSATIVSLGVAADY
jgi:hypothetical protein